METSERQKARASCFRRFGDQMLADFGFSRVPKAADDILDGKLNAHLLLSSNPAGQIVRWSQLIHEWRSLERAEDDEALLDRAADALLAAKADPESYPKAEALLHRDTHAAAPRDLSSVRGRST